MKTTTDKVIDMVRAKFPEYDFSEIKNAGLVYEKEQIIRAFEAGMKTGPMGNVFDSLANRYYSTIYDQKKR